MIGTRSAFYLGMTLIHPILFKSQNDSIEQNQPIVFHDQNKQESNKISQSLFDSPNRLKQLEQLSWNVDRTGEIGKWDIARATNFQVDSEKHPYLNAALRGVNNTAGFVACIENMATNSAGTILFDLPAAIEDLSVEHGGPSFQELVVSMQGATPGMPDELVPYAFSRIASYSKQVRTVLNETSAIEQISIRKFPTLERLSLAAQEIDRNGLTKAGRAFQKHSNRLKSVFPKSPNQKLEVMNREGQKIVEEILFHPDSKIEYKFKEKLGGNMIEVRHPDRRGLRFDESFNLRGFLEP